MKVLVTAVGGDFGQALVKSLRVSPEKYFVWGTDAKSAGIGSKFVDAFAILPRADKPEAYLKALNNLCCRNKIKVVVPASELEIKTIAKASPDLRLPCGTIILSQTYKWISMYGDKLRCMEKLAGQISLPAFSDGKNSRALQKMIKKTGFPVVVKPRFSSGSRAIYIAHNREDLNFFLKKVPQPIVQEYLSDRLGEYSVGAFVSGNMKEFICFKRTLGSVGCTWFAEVVQDSQVLAFSKKLARLTHLSGAANFQVRKTAKGIGLLEINPRFSSLVAARALCGFYDLDWSIKQRLGLKVKQKKGTYLSLRFQRFFHEMIDFGNGFKSHFSFNAKGKMVCHEND